MSRAYEVRDVQYLLGLLADEGVINPQEIGANGGSYGGGMSLQLGSLKDRVQLPNGELIPWVSPKGTPMKIEATAPEVPWTDLSQSLQPNGSNLDYVANAPYSGVLGNHEFGIQKRNWNESLYFGGLALGGSTRHRPPNPKRTSPNGSASTAQAAPITVCRWQSSRKHSCPTTAPTTRTCPSLRRRR